MLPNEAILEFQEIYLRNHGEKLSFDEAKKRAEEFMTLFKEVYKPLKKSWLRN